MSIDRKSAKVFFDLRALEWFDEDSFDALSDLYSKDCQTDNERDLVVDLIKKTVYLTSHKFDSILNRFVQDITSKFQEVDTLVLATSMEDTPDSSQLVLYQMKSKFSEYNWHNIDMRSKIKNLPTYARNKINIILVDEFVGTGTTMINRVKTINKVLSEKSITGYTIYIYVVAGTEEGIFNIMENNIDITYDIELDKGISDHYKGEMLSAHIEHMQRLESILLPNYGKCILSETHFGYGGSESLYKREGGNTPNNVFPIFWWKKYINSDDRKTLMTRSC